MKLEEGHARKKIERKTSKNRKEGGKRKKKLKKNNRTKALVPKQVKQNTMGRGTLVRRSGERT